MRIEIIKTKEGFEIPQLRAMKVADRLYGTVEMLPSYLDRSASQSKGKTVPMLQKTIRQLGGDDLLEGIMRRLPERYYYVPDHLSDEDIWYETLKEKYEL